MFLLISQIYRNKLDQYIQERKIQNTRDFGNFIRQNSLLFLVGVLMYPYYIGTLIFVFFIKMDITLYFIFMVNMLGAFYIITTLILRPDIRKKIL